MRGDYQLTFSPVAAIRQVQTRLGKERQSGRGESKNITAIGEGKAAQAIEVLAVAPQPCAYGQEEWFIVLYASISSRWQICQHGGGK